MPQVKFKKHIGSYFTSKKRHWIRAYSKTTLEDGNKSKEKMGNKLQNAVSISTIPKNKTYHQKS